MNFEIKEKRIFKRAILIISLALLMAVLVQLKVSAAVNNTMNFQTRITNKTTGLNVTTGSPACIVSGVDTCDFRIRIWNISSGGTATAGNNLLYEELFNNIEIGDSSGRLDLKINSVCLATAVSSHSWSTTGTSSTLCNLFDDNGDADSTTGVNFDRADLYLELTLDPSGTWTSLASPPGGIETFTRTPLMSVPSVFAAQTLSGASTDGFVILSPSVVQNTTSSTGAIRINQQGAGDLLQLQTAGTDRVVVTTASILQLSQTGTNGGLLLGGDTNLYRSAANTLQTDGSFIIDLNMLVDGLSNFTGDLRSLLTIGNGSTTTTGTGTSRVLTVSSTSNFDVGNLILLNGSTYAKIDSIDSTVQMTVSPSVTWSASQSVVEEIPSNIGGDGSTLTQQFDNLYLTNGLRVGADANGTFYEDGQIRSTRNLKFDGGSGLDINTTGAISINTSGGVAINKNDLGDVAGSWGTGASGNVARLGSASALYNGKIYIWGGNNTGLAAVNTMNIYNISTNTWSSGTSGGTARFYMQAVVYNGSIYYWGGTTNFSSALNTMDIYNIASDSWSTGATGGIARNGQTATLYNGSIYYWGGQNASSTLLNSVDIYDISSNTWSTGASGGTAKFLSSAVIYNGKIYIWAGYLGTYQNSLDIYTISTNTWTTGVSGGTVRAYHGAVVFNNKMYTWGGYNGSYLNTMDIFDFGTNTWTTGTTGGTARYINSFQLYNGKFYAWGGYNGSYQNLLDIFTFGVNNTVLSIKEAGEEKLKLDTSNVITISGQALGLKYVIADSPLHSDTPYGAGTAGGTARQYHRGVEYDGKIYNWGGCTTNACAALLNTMDIFDIASSTWTTGTSGGTARWYFGMVQYSGKIYITSGCTNTGVTCSAVTNTVDIYDIANNNWTTGTAGGTARGATSSELYNGKIYVWGGFNGTVNINTIDIYDIAGNSWTTGTAGGTARRFITGVEANGKLYFFGGFVAAVSNILDIYDISGNSWTTGTVGTVAKDHVVPIVYNNQIYYFGGFTTVAINTVQIYDIGADTWFTGLTGGSVRYGFTNIPYNGKMYIWGGFVAATTNTMDVYTFNPGGSWTIGFTTTGTSRSFIQSIAYNGKIYAWGGTSGGVALTSMGIYNIATRSWTSGTSGGTGRRNYSEILYNGKIYIWGGCNAACSASFNTLDIYDIANNSWSTGATGGTGRNSHVGWLYNGKFYNWGGFTSTLVNSMDIYDIASNTWSVGTTGGTVKSNSTGVVYKDKMYAWSGFTSAGVNTMDVFDLVNNTWATGTAGGTARFAAGAVVHDNKLYGWGGCTSVAACSSFLNTTDVYDFDRNLWMVGDAGGALLRNFGDVEYNGKMYITDGDFVNSYNFIIRNAPDVFYIGNTLGVGTTDGKLFRFDAAGRAYTSPQGGWFSVGADYAEYMHTNDTSIEAGDIVKLDENDGKSILKAKEGDKTIVGVISTSPGFVGNITTIEDINNNRPDMKLLSMVGQVPVKVSGNIEVGDSVAASNILGVGRKAQEGDSNIGIAQESHQGEDIGIINVLITRNNDGINNKVEIDLGTKGEGGFRLSEGGKMQFKNKDGNWQNISDSGNVTEGILWNQVGDNISVDEANVAIGLDSINKNDGKLQISKSLESKDGLSFVKITSEGSIQFGSSDIGFRVNSDNNSLEYKDQNSDGWRSLSGLLISRTRFDKDTKQDVPNQLQISGWNFIQSDGINKILSKNNNFPMTYNYQPIVSARVIGVSAEQPKKLSDCLDVNNIENISVSEVNVNSFKVNLTVPVEEGKYYCYTWLAN